MTRRIRFVVAALMVCLGAAACGHPGADKAGGAGGFRTLRVATDDPPGRASGRQLEDFASRVRDLSGGRLRIQLVFRANGSKPVLAFDQGIARRVIDGSFPLALVPARAWDLLGVTSLQALQTPFLVTSDRLLDAVVADPVAADMLAGLRGVGVSGLALWPEALRHPVGFSRPLVSVNDFAGARIRAPLSSMTWEVLRALGSEPIDLNGDQLFSNVSGGRLEGAESQLDLVSSLPRPGTTTANVTFFPKVNALVANTGAFSRLTASQRRVLTRAATATRQEFTRDRTLDVEAARSACRNGASVTVASAADVAALVRATRPVRDRLERDARTRAIIARITALAATVPPDAAVQPCVQAGGTAGPERDAEEIARLSGTWRFSTTYDEGVAAGLAPETGAHEMGVHTVVMTDGAFTWTWRARDGQNSCDGTYTSDGSTLTFREAPPCTGIEDASYALQGDKLTFRNGRSLTVDHEADILMRLLFAKQWQRILARPRAATPPDGVYRWAVTEAELVAAGVAGSDAYFNNGTSTFTIRHGRWNHHQPNASNPPDCGGSYDAVGRRVFFHADPGPQCGTAAGQLLFSGLWSVAGGGLRFTDVQPQDVFSQTLWGSKPWQKIG